MRKRILTILSAGLALSLLGAAPALAHDHGAPAPVPTHQLSPVDRTPLFLMAELAGNQEVPVPGGPAVGDPDGRATAQVLVLGNRATFAFRWSGISAPTLGHIHAGGKGVNGPVKVGLFAEKGMPDTVTAAAGAVTVTDPAIVTAIRSNPTGFYLNLHTSEFPGGAVRGQLAPAGHRLSPLDLVDHGPLHAFLSGDQEVPVAGGPAVGDPHSLAIALIRPDGNRVGYSLAWTGVAPTLGHIHQGTFGVNGPVAVPLFTAPVPSGIFAVSGTVSSLDPELVNRIRSKPTGFYVNLHTAMFPGGAVRGQLFS
ncbi:CHRD domain-containing protein [Frankia sp. CiP3]|uniref:CHRD domain-containing protein n=1 Tax=Frankia sp. CiP3 TaxID=2880971 RepID=UPI001EF72E2B|nr:CHRD domain-containing protein [Frankia sp. CiP3]